VSEKQDGSKEGSEDSVKSDKADEKAVKAPATEAEAGSTQKPAKRSSGVAWLALLLVIGVAGAGAWFGTELQRREATLKARLAELESVAAQETADLAARG